MTTPTQRTLLVGAAAVILLVAGANSCIANDRRLEGSLSPDGQREVLVSDKPIEGIRGYALIIRQLAPPMVIDIVSFHQDNDDLAQPGTIHWNTRSDCFLLDAPSFRFSYRRLYVLTKRGFVDYPFPGYGLKAEAEMKKATEENKEKFGDSVGFPQYGGEFVGWVNDRAFQISDSYSQQYQHGVFGYHYVITIKILPRARCETQKEEGEVYWRPFNQ